ncbi:MAG: transcriptional repressor [Rhizobiales bacterium]|nr:transcriptional repressor [Hyphomicrobiales bacterium]
MHDWTNARTADRLRSVGLRPTRQRIALARLLFSGGHRHVTAERLHEEAASARMPVSLATVYNTLNQFTDAGLLRAIPVDGSLTYFDTNTLDHHHFYIEGEGSLFDVPCGSLEVVGTPATPAGMEVASIDVVVRLRRTTPR